MNPKILLSRKKNNNFSFFCICLVISALCFSCNHNQNNNLVTKPTEQFPNNTWTFKKVKQGDDLILDKTLKFTANIDDVESLYDVAITFDFLSDIPVQELPLVLTTISEDGNSTQSINVLLELDNKDFVQEIGTENGLKVKRFTKLIYPQKRFSQTGTYTFEIYSKYPKISLSGVKALSISVEKNNSNPS